MRRLLFICSVVVFICAANGVCGAARMTITGSTTVQPIAEKIAESYMSGHKGIEIDIQGGGSGNGLKAIIDGTTDIGNASRFIKKKELQYAHGKGIYPVPFQIAYDCIIPIVHPNSNIKNLTIEQLRKIYIGLVNNWRSVGGSDLPIKVISRDTSSGTYEIWEKKVMDGLPVLPGAQLALSNRKVVRAVAGDRNAVGYIGLGYLSSKVKAVGVNGVEGSVKTTLNGTYLLSRPLYMFTRGWPTGETLRFINYVMNPNLGQKLVAACGFVALYECDASICDDRRDSHSDPNYLDETTVTIQMVQEYLSRLGYPVGPVDGIKGSKTIHAIVAFQKQNNLPVEQRISKKMVSLLTKMHQEMIDAYQ